MKETPEKQTFWPWLLLLLCTSTTFPDLSTGQEPSVEQDSTPPSAPVVSAKIVSRTPGHRAVSSIGEWRRNAGRTDWIRKDDWIAYDQAGDDGTYEIYRVKLNGGFERCLTCDNYDLRKKSAFSPQWHPSGEYLVFTVQSLPPKRMPSTVELTTPYRALHTELWAMTADGRRAWTLTRVGQDGGAVLDPQFSHEAATLAWSERVATRSARSGPWGEWVIRVADFSIRRGLPKLGNVRTLESEEIPGLLVVNGFSGDDRSLLVSAPPSRGRDIVRLEIDSRSVERLTATSSEHDSSGKLSPRDDVIAWVSDRSIGRRPGQRFLHHTDVWIMKADGTRKERLSYFNHPRSKESLGEALIGNISWGPDGERLLVQVLTPEIGGDGPTVRESVYLITLDREKLLS